MLCPYLLPASTCVGRRHAPDSCSQSLQGGDSWNLLGALKVVVMALQIIWTSSTVALLCLSSSSFLVKASCFLPVKKCLSLSPLALQGSGPCGQSHHGHFQRSLSLCSFPPLPCIQCAVAYSRRSPIVIPPNSAASHACFPAYFLGRPPLSSRKYTLCNVRYQSFKAAGTDEMGFGVVSCSSIRLWYTPHGLSPSRYSPPTVLGGPELLVSPSAGSPLRAPPVEAPNFITLARKEEKRWESPSLSAFCACI